MASWVVCDRELRTDRQQRATRNEANENEADVTDQVTAGCHDDTPLVDHYTHDTGDTGMHVASRLTDVCANELITRNTWTHVRSRLHTLQPVSSRRRNRLTP